MGNLTKIDNNDILKPTIDFKSIDTISDGKYKITQDIIRAN